MGRWEAGVRGALGPAVDLSSAEPRFHEFLKVKRQTTDTPWLFSASLRTGQNITSEAERGQAVERCHHAIGGFNSRSGFRGSPALRFLWRLLFLDP